MSLELETAPILDGRVDPNHMVDIRVDKLSSYPLPP